MVVYSSGVFGSAQKKTPGRLVGKAARRRGNHARWRQYGAYREFFYEKRLDTRRGSVVYMQIVCPGPQWCVGSTSFFLVSSMVRFVHWEGAGGLLACLADWRRWRVTKPLAPDFQFAAVLSILSTFTSRSLATAIAD